MEYFGEAIRPSGTLGHVESLAQTDVAALDASEVLQVIRRHRQESAHATYGGDEARAAEHRYAADAYAAAYLERYPGQPNAGLTDPAKTKNGRQSKLSGLFVGRAA